MRQQPAEWRARHRATPAPPAEAAPQPAEPRRSQRTITVGHDPTEFDPVTPRNVLAIVAVHVALGFGIRSGYPVLATLHAVLTFALGLWYALQNRPSRVAIVVGYIVGAEVFWRMTGAQIPWEFGKYATSVLMIVSIGRTGHMRPPSVLPVVYFALLLPSAVLTLTNESFDAARGSLSFYLSGPLALMVGAWFFSTVKLSVNNVRWTLLLTLAPIFGVAALAGLGVAEAGDLALSTESNLATSGGFGPNQVSAVLGLGALISLLLAFDVHIARPARLMLLGGVLWLGIQSALTFSRGGLYTASAGALIATYFMARDAKSRGQVILLLVGVVIVANFFARPYLNAFTGGALGARFEDTSLTGRDRLIEADLDLFKENMLLGVGPGEGGTLRGQYFVNDRTKGVLAVATTRTAAAHTEFSRLLAEHGIFGLLAMLLILGATVANISRGTDARAKAIVSALACWSALFMVSNAMRIVAPSICLAFGFAWLAADQTVLPSIAGRHRRLWTEKGSGDPVPVPVPSR